MSWSEKAATDAQQSARWISVYLFVFFVFSCCRLISFSISLRVEIVQNNTNSRSSSYHYPWSMKKGAPSHSRWMLSRWPYHCSDAVLFCRVFLFSVLLVLFSFSSHSSQTKQRNRQHSALQFHILSCFLLFSRLNCFCVSTSAGMRETNSERAFVHSLILPSRAQSYSFSKWATSHVEYNSIVVQVFSWILYLFIFWLLLFFWKYVYVWQHRQLQYVRLASLAGWVAELAPPSFKWHHVHGGEMRLETHCRREDGM